MTEETTPASQILTGSLDPNARHLQEEKRDPITGKTEAETRTELIEQLERAIAVSGFGMFPSKDPEIRNDVNTAKSAILTNSGLLQTADLNTLSANLTKIKADEAAPPPQVNEGGDYPNPDKKKDTSAPAIMDVLAIALDAIFPIKQSGDGLFKDMTEHAATDSLPSPLPVQMQRNMAFMAA